MPGAIIFDLGRGPINAPPGRSTPTNPDVCSDGYIAASTAKTGAIAQGSVGGGTGARAGGLTSGFGTASTMLANGIVVAAAVIVNSGGGVYNTVDTTCELYGLWLEDSNEFGDVRAPVGGCGSQATALPPLLPGQNTTIGVVATNAPLTASQAQRMAIIAGDGMARSIRPAHGNGDGDTVFGVVTGRDVSTVAQTAFQGNTSQIYNAAADAYSRAIVSAVLHADPTLATNQTYCERFPTACPSGGLPPGGAAAVPAAAAKPTPPAASVPASDGGSQSWLPLAAMAVLLAALAAWLVARPGRSLVRRLLVPTGLMLVAFGVAAAPALATNPTRPVPLPTGPNNAITDVPGIEVGHSTRVNAMTGTTTLVFPTGAMGGFASLGGAPVTHLVELLTGQHQDSQRVPIHGLIFSGGSVYGLDTLCGARAFLDSKGLGFGGRAHVSGATIFDLGRGQVDAPPGTGADPCVDGFTSATNAKGGPVAQGSVGAGTGAVAGGLKSGLGTASTVLADGTVVGALVVVNASGRVFNALGDCELYGLELEQGGEFGTTRKPPSCGNEDLSVPVVSPLNAGSVGVVATSAALTGGQTEQLARIAADGQTLAVRPAHGSQDGDAVFAVTIAEEPATVAQTTFVEGSRLLAIYQAAIDTYARAVTHAILNADPALGETYCERFKQARCPKVKKQDAAVIGALPITGAPPAATIAPVVEAPSAVPAATGAEGGGATMPLLLIAALALLALGAAFTRPARRLTRRVAPSRARSATSSSTA